MSFILSLRIVSQSVTQAATLLYYWSRGKFILCENTLLLPFFLKEGNWGY